MNKSNNINNKPKLVFKRFPHLAQLIKKLTDKNTPDNITFTYYNKLKVNVQSGTNDYMSVYVKEIQYTPNGNEREYLLANFTFDYLTMDVNIVYAKTNDVAMDIMHTFKQLYPDNKFNNITFAINKTDDIFTEEDYLEIKAKGFKCDLIEL